MAEAENQHDAIHPSGAGEPRYKIGDVCRIADVQPYVLRYWESEFPALSPDRAATGPRTYSVRELRVIERIKRLLYDEGYTIAGAKKRLENEALAAVRADIAAEPPTEEKPKAREKEKAAAPEPKARAGARPAAPPPKPADTAPVPALRPSEVTEPITAAARPAESPAADPRLPKAVAELKEILGILSRRP